MGFRNLPEMKPNNKPQFAGVGFDFGGGEIDHPVTSVNGETGTVVLDAADVGALPADTSIPTKTSDLENDSGFVDSDIIAPVETTSTASQAYTVGQYFINSLGQLCRVTVDIASGGTITVGTNCVVEPVGAALTLLNSNYVLLWANTDPSGEFSSTTLNIDMSDYDYIEVWFGASTNIPQFCNKFKVGLNVETILRMTTIATDNHELYSVSRALTVGTTGITFGRGMQWYGGYYYEWDTRCIPNSIYGIKI